MKKLFTLLFTALAFSGVWLLCLLCLSGCGRPAGPPVLPKAADVTGILVSGEGGCTGYTDSDSIAGILSALGRAVPIGRPSVQDMPSAVPCFKVDFRFEQGTGTFFLYQEKGVCYLEQPYQGIYRLDEAAWRCVVGQAESREAVE